MRMEKFVLNPVDYQHSGHTEDFNKKIADAVHVETYTKDEGRFGGHQTLVVFAFFADGG